MRDSITIAKTIPSPAYDDYGSKIVGGSYEDEQGRWIAQLGIHDDSGDRGISVTEGETFEFAGATWQVTKVFEPSIQPRGMVAELIRVDPTE